MRASDIEHLVAVGRPTIDPDGSVVVFATSRPELSANRNVGQLWRLDLPAGKPRRLTRGVADSAPQFSPDGSRVAFLRADAAATRQIFVIPAAGGEPVQASDAVGGVSEFAWSPDGVSLAYIARVPEHGRYGTVEGLDADSEAPRRITGIRWHANGLGYTQDRPAHVFVVDAPDVFGEPVYEPAPSVAPGGAADSDSDGLGPHPRRAVVAAQARALTGGTASHAGVAFTADGTRVLTVRDEVESQRRDLSTTLVSLAVNGSGAEDLIGKDSALSISGVWVLPDGTPAILASAVGESRTDFIAPAVTLFLWEDGRLRALTDPETIDLGEVGTHLSAEGPDILVQDRRRGRVRLLRVSREGAVSEVLGGDLEVNGHAAAGGTIVAAVATSSSAGEIAVVGQGVVTDFGADIAERALVHPDEREIIGRDGYPVHGWVATPAGEGPFPVILQIHGGPYASYGIHLFDETQVLVDAGYAVVYCNPRGSAGYGRAHGRAIRQAMGVADFHDVIDFLDGVLETDPRLNGARVGVMGGSYGGYLTAWIIAHDHRFAAAIVERGFLDPASFQGTSDIGSFFGDEYVGVDADAIAAQSPMAVAAQVRTPTLVIHSERDYRCPLEQATRYYTALKRAGVDTEMLIFPGEDHELTRSGRPRHRVERFEAIRDWWMRHLPAS